MDSIMHNVRDIAENDRHAIEHLTGQILRDDQRLVIQILGDEQACAATATPISKQSLPDWCNVYEGLSDEEIADIEKIALSRANLTRSPE